MAKFFIDRPIFAIVIAILIMLAGGLSILSLPIAQYPTVAPPSIQIRSPRRIPAPRRRLSRTRWCR
jgi:multidrug efflux pump subunit AcrB